MLVVDDSNRSDVKAALVRGLKPHFGDLDDLIPEKLLWTSKKGSIMLGAVNTGSGICLVRGKFISKNVVDTPEKLEQKLLNISPNQQDYQHIANVVKQLENGMLSAINACAVGRTVGCDNGDDILCQEVISLLYREPPDDPELFENLLSRFQACDIRIVKRKKGKMNLHVKGTAVPKPNRFLFDELAFFAGTAARSAGLRIPDGTVADAVSAARGEHRKFVRKVGMLPMLDTTLDNLLRRKDKKYPKLYSALWKAVNCTHSAEMLDVRFGVNGFDVSCKNCDFKIAYHPNRGVQAYPFFDGNPKLDTFLEHVFTVQKIYTAGKAVRESCAGVAEQMVRELDDTRNSIHPLIRCAPAVSQSLQRAEGFYGDARIGYVDIDGPSGRCCIAGEALPETGVSPGILLGTFRKLLDDCRKKAESIAKSQDVMPFADVIVILRSVLDHNRKFGAGTFTLLLSGSRSKRLDELDLLQSRWYGALRQYRQADIKQVIDWLLNSGLLNVVYKTRHDLPLLSVPNSVIEILDNTEDSQYPENSLPDERVFMRAIDGNDVQTVRDLCEKDFSFALYLKAAEILVPKGKEAKMAKAVFAND